MRTAIGFIVGLLIGGGAGYYGASRVLKKKHEETVANMEKQFESIEEFYKNKYESKEQVVKEEQPKVYHEDESLNAGMPAADAKAFEEITSYAKQYRSAKLDEMITKFAEEEAPVEKGKEGPRLIKVSEYGNDPTLERLTLYYYVDDGVITNEEEEAIEVDIARRMIGNAIEKFDFAHSNEQTIYVRNRKYGADYEIVKVKGAYDP